MALSRRKFTREVKVAAIQRLDAGASSLWNDQETYVEIWLEKDALAGVLYQETEQWNVPLMVARGYGRADSNSALTHAADKRRPIRVPSPSKASRLRWIRPAVLHGMVRSLLEMHIDKRILEQTRLIEEQERETLARIAANVPSL
jgi:hypothetical protein